MPSSILNVGLNGILAFQTALTVTSSNIANIYTPYYSRRAVNLSESLFGAGVNVADVQRIYESSQSKAVSNATALYGNSDMLFQQASQLENLLQDPSSSLETYMTSTLTALRELNSNVNSPQGRTTYLNNLKTLANRFETMTGLIQQQQQNVNSSLTTVATQATQLAKQIAQVNQQISGNQHQDNSALFDQREQLVQQLAQFVNFTTQTDDIGQIYIYLEDGSQLVNAGTASQLQTEADPANPQNLLMMLVNGTTQTDETTNIKQGQIAGLYSTQTLLNSTMNSLGQLALGIMDQLNKQNQLGIDSNANLGTNIFIDINAPSLLAQRVMPNTKNTGNVSMAVNITDTTQLSADNYQLQFDSSSHYIVTDMTTNTVVSSGAVGSLPQTIALNGVNIALNSGSIAAGDSYIIAPTQGVSSAMNFNITNPNLLALGWPVVAQSNQPNSGTITVTGITDTTNSSFATTGQLSPPININFISATQYQIVDASNGSVLEGPLTYNVGQTNNLFPTPGGYDPGYRVSLSGAITSGSTFSINYNKNASGDNRNGLAMESLLQNPILNGNQVSFTNAYELLAGNASAVTSQASIQDDSNNVLLLQANASFAQVSGVSYDEENNNLLMYQQAYQANAHVIEVAKNIFDTIIGIGRS